MQILGKTEKEGFEVGSTPTISDIIGPPCTKYITSERAYWLCDTDNQAQIQVRNLISTGNIRDGVCYTSYEGFYTCYTRPSQNSYDSSEGVFVTDDPGTDQMPAGIESDIINVCGDFGTTMNTFKTMYVSTVSIGGVIQSTLNIISTATANLGQISTNYCSIIIRKTDAVEHTCNTLSTGISIFNGIPNGPKGLEYMSTTVNNAISNMDNLYTNQFVNAYKGFGYSTCNFSTFTNF